MQDQAQYGLKIGTVLNHYRIIQVLGAGGFGITYLAEDISLGMRVVIKEYFPNELAYRNSDNTVIAKTSSEIDFTKGRERFKEEARVLAKFNHPSIVKILGYFEANNTAYFVMEYEEGIDLSEYMKQRGKPFTQDEVLGIIMPILEGLKEVHGHNYLHRDIKPGNILIRKNKPPVLIDFGASKLAIGEVSKSITSMLTEGYAPLEQYSTDVKQQGAFTDLYAVAAVMYKMITGEVPPSSQTRSVQLIQNGTDPYDSLVQLQPNGYDSVFLGAIDKALSIKARDRQQTIEEFQGSLMRNVVVPGSRNTPEPNEVKKKGVSKKTIVIVILSITVVLLMLSHFIKTENPPPPVVIEKNTSTVDKGNKSKIVESNTTTQVPKDETKETEVVASPVSSPPAPQTPPVLNANELLRKGKDYYFGSNGAIQNYAEAKQYFLEAAKQDSPEALRYLGAMYLFGNGVEANKVLAEELLVEAFNLGDSRAKELYVCYIQDGQKTKYRVDNLPRNDTLSVRTAPTTRSSKIDELENGLNGIVILDRSVNDDGTKWAKIKYCRNGTPKYGWVATRFLVPSYTTYVAAKYYKVVNISRDDTLNMRSGPGREYQKVGEIPPHEDTLTLLQCAPSTRGGRWCKVRYGYQEGWVSALYIREK